VASDVNPTPEWKSRTDFAEYAEALAITTTQILSVMTGPDGTTIYVMFTQTTDPDEPDLWAAGFERDADGILRQTKATTVQRGALARMHEEMARRMYERFGEPGNG
jgi:hypothetical protein